MSKIYDLFNSIISRIKNVEKSVPEHTWESLPDKPFGEVREEQVLIDSAQIDGRAAGREITTNIYEPNNMLVYEVLKDAASSGFPIRIVWDGVNYDFPNGFEATGEVTEGVDTWYIGNKGLALRGDGESLLFPDQDNGLPFCIRVTYFQVFVWFADTESHVMSIYNYPATIILLDEKFIPDIIARVEDINDMIDTKLSEIPLAEGSNF